MEEIVTPLFPDSYSKLLAELRQLITEGRARIERFIDTQTVVTNWQAGRVIYLHLQEDHPQTDYHSTIYKQLAADLDVSVRFLQRTARFYELYPELDASLPLNWTHYQVLMSIRHGSTRAAWQRRIMEEGLSATTVKQLLRDERRGALPDPDVYGSDGLADPERGQLYLYRMIKENTLHNGSELLVDLGFDCFLDRPETVIRGNFRSGDLVAGEKLAAEQYRLRQAQSGREKLYTYKASIVKVIDGDTLKVMVELGFGKWTRQNLRLRGIDTKEMYLQDGQDAKRFVIEEMAKVGFVVIKTYSHDLFDRYLVDVFYKPGCEDAHEVAETGVYLNAVLVDKGYAKRWQG